jgi:hypothetical protein
MIKSGSCLPIILAVVPVLAIEPLKIEAKNEAKDGKTVARQFRPAF